ncbi:MAG: DUF5131 family protein [Lentisphaeria bacterium]|nr:DUF5131 family protein [Lentisphaeria bacterium]
MKIDQWGKGAKYWDKAWNPVVGCRKVSEGCQYCYAERMAARFPELQDASGGFLPHPPKKPKAPPKKGIVFVGNMTDIFGEWNNPDTAYDWIASLSNDATNLILTKRPENMLQWDALLYTDSDWLGITGENQERLEQRLDSFLRVAHPNRWLSLEPLLGEICLNSAIANVTCEMDFLGSFKKYFQWVVVGAESGDKRRPCKLEWVRLIVQQCREANVPVFVKQLDIDGKLVSDIDQFPEDLQIRQVPWGEK